MAQGSSVAVKAFIVLCALATFPSLVQTASGGLDPSWMVALHKAHKEGLVFGTDIVFTYGPLGFMGFPIHIDHALWLKAAVLRLAVFVLSYAGVYLFVKKTAPSLAVALGTVAGAALLYQDLAEIQFYLTLLIFTYLGLVCSRSTGYFIVLAGAYALVLYVKFILGVTAAALCGSCVFILLSEKRYATAGALIISYAGSVLLFGGMLIGSPSAVYRFLQGSIEIAGGYNYAMSSSGEGKAPILIALAAWAGYGVLIVLSLVKRDRRSIYFLILSAGVLFASFKHEFVRHMANPFHAFAAWTLVFLFYYALVSTGTDRMHRRTAGAMALFLAVSTMLISPVYTIPHFLATIAGKAGSAVEALNIATGRGIAALEGENHAQWRKYYHLDEDTVKIIGRGRVDVFPWDSALVEFYGMNWSPRPVFQSYSAYTAYLDRLNAAHLQGPKAPEFLIYRLAAVDDRYAVFDEPLAFQAVLGHYSPVKRDGDFIVLKKRTDTGQVRDVPLGTVSVEAGQEVPVPHVNAGPVFARVFVEYNLWGKLANFFYKPPLAFIQFQVQNEATKQYRLIFANAGKGILVSPLILTDNDLYYVFSGLPGTRTRGFTMSLEKAEFFKKGIRVEFFTREGMPPAANFSIVLPLVE